MKIDPGPELVSAGFAVRRQVGRPLVFVIWTERSLDRLDLGDELQFVDDFHTPNLGHWGLSERITGRPKTDFSGPKSDKFRN